MGALIVFLLHISRIFDKSFVYTLLKHFLFVDRSHKNRDCHLKEKHNSESAFWKRLNALKPEGIGGGRTLN